MRPARVFNIFISNILPSHEPLVSKFQQKKCLNCGRLRWKPFRSFSTKVPITEPCISIIKLAQQGRSNDALVKYMRLVEKEEKAPSHETVYQLAKALYKTKHLVGMHALHNTLVQLHNTCPPSDRTRRSLTYVHTMFINLISRTSKDMQTIIQLCQLVSESIRQGNPVIYNTLIKVFLEIGEREKARVIYEELKKTSAPTIVTFYIWMVEAKKRKDLKEMIYYLDEMKIYSISPDRRMVYIVVSILCQQSQFSTAKSFVEELNFEAKKLVPKSIKEKLLLKIAKHRQKTNKHRKSYSINHNNKEVACDMIQ